MHGMVYYSDVFDMENFSLYHYFAVPDFVSVWHISVVQMVGCMRCNWIFPNCCHSKNIVTSKIQGRDVTKMLGFLYRIPVFFILYIIWNFTLRMFLHVLDIVCNKG